MKKSALIMNHLYFALFSTFLIGLAALFMEGGRGGAKKIIVGWKTISLTKFVLLGILLAFAQYSFVVLLTMEDISHTIALQPLGIIFQMILAYFLIGERQKPFKRLIFGGFIVFGSILLEMGRH